MSSRSFLLSSAQARLETSWRELFVPARLKLDFLQKYSTLERALELPRTVYLLETAGKAVPLREKVWRFCDKHDGRFDREVAVKVHGEALLFPKETANVVVGRIIVDQSAVDYRILLLYC